MLVTKEQLMTGLISYIDKDVMPLLPTQSQWILGAAVILLPNKANEIISTVSQNAVVQALGVTTPDGLIDSDNLLRALGKSAEKYGNVTMSVPLIGNLTFTPKDVENLRQTIEQVAING